MSEKLESSVHDAIHTNANGPRQIRAAKRIYHTFGVLWMLAHVNRPRVVLFFIFVHVWSTREDARESGAAVKGRVVK